VIWLWLLACIGEPRVKGPMNVLLVSLDTTRADHLGVYGYFRDTTPNLDAVASESVVYERCYSPAATTLPAHTTLFTGTSPVAHGVISNVGQGGTRFVPSPQLKSVTSLFETNGYQTVGLISAAPLRRGTGMATGFGVWDEPKGRSREAEYTTARALKLLSKRQQNKPFFVWLHYYDPHSPYRPPEGNRDRFTDVGRDAWMSEREVPNTVLNRLVEDVDTRAAMDGYDDELGYVDGQLGRVFDAMRRTGVWDNTIVLVVGDHGEGLGQHDHMGHGGLWDEQLRIPCILRVPGEVPRRDPKLASLEDWAPTLFGRLELEGESDFDAQLHGIDLLSDATKPAVLSVDAWDWDNGHAVLPSYRWKTDASSYFRNVGGTDRQYADVHELIEQELDPFKRATVDARVAELLAQRTLFGAGVTEMTDAELEQLRQLGYVQ
jgi:arylsulfatase A-like enzyme